MNLNAAIPIVEKWVQRGSKGWNMHLGYMFIAFEISQTNRLERMKLMDASERVGEPIRPEDVVTINQAKDLVHSALVALGFQPTGTAWAHTAWKHLRAHPIKAMG